MYDVQVNDGTGWQTVATYAESGDAADAARWYNDRKLKARVVGVREEDDRRLGVAVDRMIAEAERCAR